MTTQLELNNSVVDNSARLIKPDQLIKSQGASESQARTTAHSSAQTNS